MSMTSLKTEACVFCEIIEGKIPSKVIYQDTEIIVIDNILKLTQGYNLLLIPKKHVRNYIDCDDETFLKVKKITVHLKELLKLDHLYLKTNYNAPYQTVFHAHFHLKTGPRLEGVHSE